MKCCLNWWDLTWFGFGSIIGTGIFILTGQEAYDHADLAIILPYVASGISAMLSIFCYTEFTIKIPVAGGSSAYLCVELGDLAAFISAANILLGSTVEAGLLTSPLSSTATPTPCAKRSASVLRAALIMNEATSSAFSTSDFPLFQTLLPPEPTAASQLEPADPDFYKIGYVRSMRAYGIEFREGPDCFGVYASKDIEPLRCARVVLLFENVFFMRFCVLSYLMYYVALK